MGTKKREGRSIFPDAAVRANTGVNADTIFIKCIACKQVKPKSQFDPQTVGSKKLGNKCLECTEKMVARKDQKELQARVEKAKELITVRSAQNLDQFVGMVTEELGGDGQFAIMVADQIRQAFINRPGSASNLNFALGFFKVLGLRDDGNLQRDLASLSYDELVVEKQKIAKELFMDILTDSERRSFAMQVLNSTGESVIDDDMLEAHVNRLEAIDEDDEDDDDSDEQDDAIEPSAKTES